MGFETELNKLYEQIAQQVNEMIPVEWSNFYFNGEVKDKEGGVFFFFRPKDNNQEAIFSHNILCVKYFSRVFELYSSKKRKGTLS
ncbi:DUF600 family protein [Virgibacillus dakarensis]|uniref:TIGR01741 family protein n=1 Tax=Lentibacillus populi TaxID=1827502 RepID=A0A9W5U1I7_9BACI|nr:immunity protein YezG family protein [Lentibacillus populi]MTW86943.1 DUF600 family protein [Virgibacillus dakarensis]GGB57386.1 hypothetical protein GCM10011409_38600 [Lentibacillus populi]